jgi:hypothetical protein
MSTTLKEHGLCKKAGRITYAMKSITRTAYSPKNSLLLLAAAAVIIGSPASARANLLAYEGFDYAPGNLTSANNGGIGFSGAWNPNLPSGSSPNNIQVLSGSLSYTDQFGNTLVTSGGRFFATGDGTEDGDNVGGSRHNAQPFRELSFSRGSDTEDHSTWISFLAVRTGLPHPWPADEPTVQYGRASALQLFQTTSERIAIGRASQNSETSLPNITKDSWAIYNRGDANQTAASTAPLTDLVFAVVRIDHIGGANNPGNDQAFLWLNPANLLEAPDISEAITISASQFANNDRDYNFNRIRVFAGSWNSTVGYGSIEVDEIRIGTTFFSVAPVPEPSTFALAGLGLLAFGAFARRRKKA